MAIECNKQFMASEKLSPMRIECNKQFMTLEK